MWSATFKTWFCIKYQKTAIWPVSPISVDPVAGSATSTRPAMPSEQTSESSQSQTAPDINFFFEHGLKVPPVTNAFHSSTDSGQNPGIPEESSRNHRNPTGIDIKSPYILRFYFRDKDNEWWLICCSSFATSLTATWHHCVLQALVCELRVVTWCCCIVQAVLGHAVLIVGSVWLLCVVVGAGHWWWWRVRCIGIMDDGGGWERVGCLLMMPKSSIGKYQCSIWMLSTNSNSARILFHLIPVSIPSG